jgi:hypothetical protein
MLRRIWISICVFLGLVSAAVALSPSEIAVLFNRGIKPAYYVNLLTGTLPSSLTFSRAGQAMMFDATGYLTYGPNNLVLNSNNPSVWGLNSNVSLTTGVADPMGGSAATTVTATAANGYAYQQLYFGITSKYINSMWVRRRTGTGNVILFLPDGTAQTIAVTNTWTLFGGAGQVNGGNIPVQIRLAVSGDAVDIYSASLSQVTYETAPRPGDQVITTSAAYYGPRFDYDPSTLATKGLLREPAATNLFLQSGATTNAAWAGTGIALTTDGTLGPDGQLAGKYTPVASTQNHESYQSVTGLTASTPYTFTKYVKAGGGRYHYLSIQYSGSQMVAAVFDLAGTSNSTATQTQVLAATIQATSATYLGSGWFRLRITATGGTTGIYAITGYAPTATGNTFTNGGELSTTTTGAETFYYSIPQLEIGSLATSPIYTTTAAVTRAAETLSPSGPLATALAAGPSILEATSQAGVTTRAQFAAGAFAFPYGWQRGLAAYAPGTSWGYLSSHLTVGAPY